MEKDYIEVKSFGKVFPKKGANARIPYEHQKCAMENLDIMNKNAKYSTMIVLPTGGGKTYTASMWTRTRKYCGLHIVRCYLTKQQNLFRSLRIQR